MPARHIPDSLWRWVKKLNRQQVAHYNTSSRRAGLFLLLTTTGRKTGLPRTVPLQYEEIDGAYYVASARGVKADWFRNLLTNPCVRIQVQGGSYDALAEAITDSQRIADFLEYRINTHPRMVGTLLRLEGLPPGFSRLDLEAFAAEKALVILRPASNLKIGTGSSG